MGRVEVWTQTYQRQCFDAWYLGGRPNLPIRIREIIPLDENGRKPSVSTIKRWITSGMWDWRADELDARVEQAADESLVKNKIEILQRHQENAKQIEAISLTHIKAEGFDSSASAVQAYFRATEEERKTAGFSDLLEKLESMTNNQVRDQIINLINRATENDQVIEEGEETAGLLDTESTEDE